MTASLSADDKDSVHYIYVCVKGEVAKVHGLASTSSFDRCAAVLYKVLRIPRSTEGAERKG
jgi:hypothetical protein